MKITFPNLTAKEIIEACDNKLGNGKLLFSISRYKDEDFYTTEKCRPMTVEIDSAVTHLGKTWNKCKALETLGIQMLNFAEMIYFIQEYCKANGTYPDSNWSWTSSRSSRGVLVIVGYCDSDGVRVSDDDPALSGSYLGVRFSRSAATFGVEAGQAETNVGSFESRIAKIEKWIQGVKDQLL